MSQLATLASRDSIIDTLTKDLMEAKGERARIVAFIRANVEGNGYKGRFGGCGCCDSHAIASEIAAAIEKGEHGP